MSKDYESGYQRLRASLRANLSFVLSILGFGTLVFFFDPPRKMNRMDRRKRWAEKISESIENTFQKDVALESDEKGKLKEQFSKHALSYAIFESWKLVIMQFSVIVRYMVFFIIGALTPRLIYEVYNLTTANTTKFLLTTSTIISWGLLLIVVLPNFLYQIFWYHNNISENNRYSQDMLYRLQIIVGKAISRWPVITFFLYTIWLYLLQRSYSNQRLTTIITIEVIIALFTTLSIVLALKFIVIVEQFIVTVIEKWKNYNYPDSTIAVYLVLASNLLNSQNQLPDILRRRSLIEILEIIAYHIEFSLAQQLLGNSPYGGASLRKDMSKISGGVRALERQITIPNSPAWDENLRQELAVFLSNFLSLNWAALPSEQFEVIMAPTIMSRLKTSIQSILTGIIPIIIFTILQKTPFQLTGDRAELASIITVGWFIISLIILLDPDFSTKTKALKDVQDIINFKKS